MALIKCPECGRDISDKANACVHCGYPLSKVADNAEKKESNKEWYTNNEKYCEIEEKKEVTMLNNVINNEPITLQLDKVIDRCEISIDNLSKDYIFQKCVSETYTYHYINDAKRKYDESKSYSNKQIYYNEYIFHYNKLLKDYKEMKTKLQTRLPLCK